MVHKKVYLIDNTIASHIMPENDNLYTDWFPLKEYQISKDESLGSNLIWKQYGAVQMFDYHTKMNLIKPWNIQALIYLVFLDFPLFMICKVVFPKDKAKLRLK